jgi:proton glutamate symport protein
MHDIILHVFPENIAKSVVDGQVLQIVVFSIIFGIALAMLDEKRRKPMLSFAEGLSDVMFKFTNIIMYFAPIGVGAAIAYTVGHMGLGILVNLFHLLATLYVALIAFMLLVLCR